MSEAEICCKPPVVYRGENAVDKFLRCLEEEQQYIQEKFSFVEPIRISNAEEGDFRNATDCHICGFELGYDRVRDHCHLTGKFRGAAHKSMSVT